MTSRFDPAEPLEITPPFVRWTLAHPCAVREFDDYFDPDRMDRLLRGVRCFSDAMVEGRVRQGVVVQRNVQESQKPLGFHIDAVLEPLGGEDFLRSICSGCPANALERMESAPLAGCVGHLVPPVENSQEFYQYVDDIFESYSELTQSFISTLPHWFGLWINERPTPDEAKWQREVLSQLLLAYGDSLVGLADYLAAIEAYLEHAVPLVVRAYPGGRCEGRKWYVEPHCGRCKAPWPEARRQQCRVCNHVGGRQPEQRRLRMGTRPYRPLAEFLGEEEVANRLH
jgi:hypothetical protein